MGPKEFQIPNCQNEVKRKNCTENYWLSNSDPFYKTQWDPPLRQGGPVLKSDPMDIIFEGVNFFCR